MIMLAIIFISFFLPFFLSLTSFRAGAVVDVGVLMVIQMGWFGHRCVHLDTESAQHRQCTVERLKSLAGLDAGQTSPVEAELELVDQLLLGEPLHRARVAQHPAEIFTGPNPILPCAHIDTLYLVLQMCQ